jgi:hypothetical protein
LIKTLRELRTLRAFVKNRDTATVVQRVVHAARARRTSGVRRITPLPSRMTTN